MEKATRGSERRDEALSRAGIVDAAIELLDEHGEIGLTFRALATRLETGSGAIYWHVASKSELLVAASDAVIDRAMAQVLASATPHEALHAIAAGVFEAIDAHPWVGAQLSRAPWQTAVLQILERIGRQVHALGVKGASQFTAASALLSYIVGVSTQNALNARLADPSVGRADFLESVSSRLDAREYPFLCNIATQLRDHDDRAEYLAGLDLILTGVAASICGCLPKSTHRIFSPVSR